MNNDKLILFSCNSNLRLAKNICRQLGIKRLGKAKVKKFSDKETQVEIGESVRGTDVFVIQSTCNPANDNLMELLIMIDALKRASAKRITAVLPYYGYARQDRKVAPRAPITAKLVADLITAAGGHRILTVDLHAGQIQGFFNIPVDHLFAQPVMLDQIRKNYDRRKTVVVAADAGGVERATSYAKKLKTDLAIIDKRRDKPNHSRSVNIIGRVKGRYAWIIEDLVDTAGTICESAKLLLKKGAAGVGVICTHLVLSGPAIKRIEESPIDYVIGTDTIPLRGIAKKCRKISVLSISGLLAAAIKRIHEDDSVSSLFD